MIEYVCCGQNIFPIRHLIISRFIFSWQLLQINVSSSIKYKNRSNFKIPNPNSRIKFNENFEEIAILLLPANNFFCKERSFVNKNARNIRKGKTVVATFCVAEKMHFLSNDSSSWWVLNVRSLRKIQIWAFRIICVAGALLVMWLYHQLYNAAFAGIVSSLLINTIHRSSAVTSLYQAEQIPAEGQIHFFHDWIDPNIFHRKRN